MLLSQVTGKSHIGSYSQRGDRSTVGKQIAGYFRQVWGKKVWFYDGQHEFRPGHICES